MKSIFIITLGVLSYVATCKVVPAATTAENKPNVLFVAVDDLNDWIGCLKGHPQAKTPNMDRLAARGLLFTNAHCAAPACNPSRAAVFSGKMPNVTEVWSNDSGSIDKVSPGRLYLSAAFKKAGYRTLGTGKLFHGSSKGAFDQYQPYSQRWSPFAKGAVSYTKQELPSKGTNNPRHVLQDSQGRTVILPINRMPSDRKPNAVSAESFDWGGFDLPDADWGDTQAAQWAIDRLNDKRTEPLFLAVGFYRPHIPLFAPQRFFERFKDDPGILPPYNKDDLNDLSSLGKKWAVEAITAGSHATVVKHNQWQTAVESYLACVTYVDFEIGRVLKTLDQSQHADNTWIVLWSDHGWQLGEKDHWGKWTGWERSTKVPLIIVPPKNQAADFASPGSVCNRPVGLIDLYPTLLQACNVNGPKRLDGKSLVALLKNPQAKFRNTTLTMFDEGNASLRSSRYRYIRYKDASEELYDLTNDPNEWTNVAGSNAMKGTIAMMRNALGEHLSSLESAK